MSKVCPCPNPPGGHIVCEDNQFGICAYENGKQVGGCKNIPASIAAIADDDERNVATINWLLSVLTGVRRQNNDEITEEQIEMLKSGEYRDRKGNLKRFALPENIQLDNRTGGIAATY